VYLIVIGNVGCDICNRDVEVDQIAGKLVFKSLNEVLEM